MGNIFHTYFIGIILNVIAGFIVYLIVRNIFDWLPTTADLHEKFRAVASERNAKDKIVELTPLIFISFFWLFLANMLWVLQEVFIEILNWPDLYIEMLSRAESSIPENTEQFIRGAMPGLMTGRSILCIILGLTIAKFFANGFSVAKQCWDVYRSINNKS